MRVIRVGAPGEPAQRHVESLKVSRKHVSATGEGTKSPRNLTKLGRQKQGSLTLYQR